jgi:hypothetical protein
LWVIKSPTGHLQNKREAPECHIAQGGAILKPPHIIDGIYPLQHLSSFFLPLLPLSDPGVALPKV